MGSEEKTPITELLNRVKPADRKSIDRLLPLVYEELKQMAHRQHGSFAEFQTLNTTSLVHEAYIKIVGQEKSDWHSRAQFFYIAASAMRQILLDYARAKKSRKRGGDLKRVELNEEFLLTDEEADTIIVLEDALTRLSELNERQSRIVECRFYAGMTIEETAAVLGISVPTANRDWRLARAWLYKEVSSDFSFGGL